MDKYERFITECLCYDPKTGSIFRINASRVFFETTRSWKLYNTRFSGKYAGYNISTNNGKKYRYLKVLGKSFLFHRVAFFIAEKRWPDNEIDHINGDGTDNRRCNLREVTHSQNGKNQKLHKNNKSGVSGLHWNTSKKIWIANIGVNGKQIHLGSFKMYDDAKKARERANIKYGFHCYHGI